MRAWSQYVAERARKWSYSRCEDLCFGTASGPVGASVDGGKFAGDLKIREIFPAGLEGAGLD